MRELEHIAFGDQPIAEIDAFHGESVAAAVDQSPAVGMDEIGRCGEAGPIGGGQRGRGADTATEGAAPRTVTSIFSAANVHQPHPSGPLRCQNRATAVTWKFS